MRNRTLDDHRWGAAILLLGGMMLQACATAPGPLRGPLRDEMTRSLAGNYVYDRPIESVWPEVRRLLADSGFVSQEAPDAFIIVTDWKERMDGSMVSGVWTRYLAQAERIQADRCIVRFVKHEVVASERGTDGVARSVALTEKGYGNLRQLASTIIQWGARDLTMEWRLLEHLKPDTARQIEAEADRRIMGGATAPVALVAPAAPSAPPAPTPAPAMAVTETPAAPASPEAPAAPAVEPEMPATPAGPCGQEIFGARPLLVPGGLLLLGEMHGSREIPAFVVTLACLAASGGTPVTLGVEMSRDAQPDLERYLEGGGSKQEIARLLTNSFWHRAYQDGRSSQAMLEQIERVRQLRARKLPISLLAYDDKDLSGNPRQEAMARRILEARARAPQSLFLILCGNVQARTVRGVEWEPDLLPLGARLLAVEPRMKSLDAEYLGGTAWTCRVAGAKKFDCRDRLVAAPQRTRILGRGIGSSKVAQGFERYRTYMRLDEGLSPEGYHGVFYVGRLTASPPAAENL